MVQQTAILSPTENQIVQAQQRAEAEAARLATTITGVNDPEQDANIREILPDQDLTTTATNGWTQTNREWTQAGLTADQAEDVYDIDSNNQAQDKVVVIYGLANLAGDPITTEVAFQDGTGATFYRVNTQMLEIAEISDAILFEQEVVYGSTEDGTIIQWPNAAGDDTVVYLAKVAEPLGDTVSTRQRAQERFRGR